MARNLDRTNKPNNVSNFKAADGFLNVDIVGKSGATKSIGGIPLNINKEIHAILLEHAERIDDFEIVVSIKKVDNEVDLSDDFGPSSPAANPVDTTAALAQAFKQTA